MKMGILMKFLLPGQHIDIELLRVDLPEDLFDAGNDLVIRRLRRFCHGVM